MQSTSEILGRMLERREAIARELDHAFPDHQSYLIHMMQNPMTDTVADIVANPHIFNSMNMF